MRTIIRLFAILAFFAASYGQDREPSPWLFRWGFSDTERAFVPDSFQQKSMLLGFQWSGTRILDSFLMHDTRANHGYDSANPRRYKLNFINQPAWWDRGGYSIGAWNAPFMQYEPTLYFENPADTGKILTPGDNSRYVFGFLQRRGRVPADSTDPHFHSLIIDSVEQNNQVVLAEPWPCNQLAIIIKSAFQTNRYI